MSYKIEKLNTKTGVLTSIVRDDERGVESIAIYKNRDDFPVEIKQTYFSKNKISTGNGKILKEGKFYF